MNILNLLLISFCISASLIGNESDLFNQNRPGRQEKIKTGLGENANNKYYRNGLKIGLIGLNLVAGAAGAGVAATLLVDNNEPLWSLPFIAGAVINGVSAFDLDAKHSKKNVTIGVTNLLWGVANGLLMATVLLCGAGNPEQLFFVPYWGFKGTVNIANAIYRLYSVRKQKN